MILVPTIGWAAIGLGVWFVLTLAIRHPGIAAVVAAATMAILFPLAL